MTTGKPDQPFVRFCQPARDPILLVTWVRSERISQAKPAAAIVVVVLLVTWVRWERVSQAKAGRRHEP